MKKTHQFKPIKILFGKQKILKARLGKDKKEYRAWLILNPLQSRHIHQDI